MSKAKKVLRQRDRATTESRERTIREARRQREADLIANAPARAAEHRQREDVRRGDNRRVELLIAEVLDLAAELDYPGAELIKAGRRLHPLFLRRTVAGWHLGGSWKKTPLANRDSETGDWVTHSVRCTNEDFYLLEDGRVVGLRAEYVSSIFNFSRTEQNAFESGTGSEEGQSRPRYLENGAQVHRSSASTIQKDVRRFESEVRRLLRFLQEQ